MKNVESTSKVILEKTYSIEIAKIYYCLSIILNEKTINLTLISQSASSNYEGIFTYENFLEMSKFFYLQETLKDIYEVLVLKFNKKETEFKEETDSLILLMKFSFNEVKTYEVLIKIPKNYEVDSNIIQNNMSKTIIELSENMNQMLLKNSELSENMNQMLLRNSELQTQIKHLEIKNSNLMKENLDKNTLNENKKIESLISTIWKQDEVEMINGWLNFKAKFEPLYKSIWHGKEAKDFHSRCDGKGPTITFIETTDGFRFGAFTDIKWDSSNVYRSNDPYTFIFSLDKKTKLTCIDQSIVLYGRSDYGPTFGGGHDIYIANNFTGSYSKLLSYNESEHGEFYLTGKRELAIKDVEVYLVTK